MPWKQQWRQVLCTRRTNITKTFWKRVVEYACQIYEVSIAYSSKIIAKVNSQKNTLTDRTKTICPWPINARSLILWLWIGVQLKLLFFNHYCRIIIIHYLSLTLNTVDIFVEIVLVLMSLGFISAMKNVFHVDVRHLLYQTFIKFLFHLMLYNNSVLMQNK